MTDYLERLLDEVQKPMGENIQIGEHLVWWKQILSLPNRIAAQTAERHGRRGRKRLTEAGQNRMPVLEERQEKERTGRKATPLPEKAIGIWTEMSAQGLEKLYLPWADASPASAERIRPSIMEQSEINSGLGLRQARTDMWGAGLSPERMDRIIEQDARRYSGPFPLY